MAVAAGAFAADLDGLVPRNRLHRARLGGLQRGDAGLHPRPGLADAPDRTRRMGRMDEHLRPQLGPFRRPGVPELRAAVRTPVQRGLARFPRHDRKSTRLNSSPSCAPRMQSNACKTKLKIIKTAQKPIEN